MVLTANLKVHYNLHSSLTPNHALDQTNAVLQYLLRSVVVVTVVFVVITIIILA